MNRYKTVGFYTMVVVWGLCVTALIVHLFFPYQRALKIAFQSIVGGNSKMVVSMEGVRLTPSGVRITKALVGHEALQGKPVAELSDITIAWRPWSLLTGRFSVASEAQAYNGTVRCDVIDIPILTNNNPSMRVSFSDINLAKYPANALPWFRGMSGTVDGSITREVHMLHPAKEKGAFRFAIRNGEIRELHMLNFPGLRFPFKEIMAEGKMNGSQAIVDKLFLDGSGITIKGSGTITKGDLQPTMNLELLYESHSKTIPLPPRGTIVVSGSQWPPTVTVSTEMPDKEKEAEKK